MAPWCHDSAYIVVTWSSWSFWLCSTSRRTMYSKTRKNSLTARVWPCKVRGMSHMSCTAACFLYDSRINVCPYGCMQLYFYILQSFHCRSRWFNWFRPARTLLHAYASLSSSSSSPSSSSSSSLSSSSSSWYQCHYHHDMMMVMMVVMMMMMITIIITSINSCGMG